MCLDIIRTCKAVTRRRLSSGPWAVKSLCVRGRKVKTRALQFLWKHESDVIWDNRRPKWIFFVCTPTASARHSPPLQRGLFTLHSLFDTRATVQPLPLCQTLHARFPALTASNWILMCSWRPPPSSGRSFLKAIAGTKSGKEQRMREMATV